EIVRFARPVPAWLRITRFPPATEAPKLALPTALRVPNSIRFALIVVEFPSVSWLATGVLAIASPTVTVPAVIVLLGARITVPAARLNVVVLLSPNPTRKPLTLALKIESPERSSVARPAKDPPLLPWRM